MLKKGMPGRGAECGQNPFPDSTHQGSQLSCYDPAKQSAPLSAQLCLTVSILPSLPLKVVLQGPGTTAVLFTIQVPNSLY